MISSVFSLKEANVIPDYLVSNPETRLEENYYFNSSLDFLLECQNELLSYRKDFYKTVLESGDENLYIVNEAFNDIIQKIKEIIKKILAYIESIVKRFVTSFGKFVSSDKYIIKMKKEISKFPSDKSFNISGYNYTFNDNIPMIDITGLEISEIEIAIRNLEKSDDISIKINELTTALSKFTTEEKITEARSQILGVMNDIPDASFANEVFAIYRDGKSSEFDIEIKKSDVNKAMNDYEGYKDKIKEVNRFKSNISAKYKTLESKVDSIIKADIKPKIDSSSLDQKKKYVLSNTMTTLINDLVSFIQRVANYHTMAFAGKLDAYNAATIQDRNILYKALNIVQKDINNTKIMENYDSYDYTRDAAYKGYIIERYYMNKEQQRFVEECLALSESNIPELKTIHEDLKMDVKGKFGKLKDLIQQIFNKFIQKIKSFFNRDKKFLIENKDTILNKQIPKYTLNNMPQYSLGIKNLRNTNLPIKSDIDKLVSLSEEDVKKSILPAYDGKSEFNEFAVRFFLCNNTENKDRSSTDKEEVNMQNIYDFCLNDDILKIIQNDTKDYNNEVNKVQAKILNSMSESFMFDEYGCKYLYSTVLETFINEDDASDKQSSKVEINANNQSNSDQNAKSGTELKLDINKEDKKDDNNQQDNAKETNDDNKDSTETKANNTKLKETGDWYLKYLRIAMTAKMTAYQQIYTEYMKIIRYHISVANGQNSTTENQEEIRKSLKDYLKADKDSKESAANKVIDVFKKIGRKIDRHDVDTLVNQNKSELEKE